ncbi:MAG: hypothetical protein U9O96_07290 [Candidatus Thermoplasmatota archaeon]|nr:hypothetical protein [Candidatus Thermoplasmatota archaeon]
MDKLTVGTVDKITDEFGAKLVSLGLKPFLSINIPIGIADITKMRGQTSDRREISNALTSKSSLASEDMGAKVSHDNCESNAIIIKIASTTHR